MSSKMKLVGIHMTPQEQQREAMLADAARLQEAFAGDRINPRLLPAPRSPMTPVFADEAGNRFLMQSTPRGMVATPMPESPDGDLLGRPQAGGFVPWSQLQGMAKDAPNLGYPSNLQLVEAAKKALLNGPANETEAGEKKTPPKKPNPFVQVGQSMLQGLPNMIAGQLADATQQAGSIAGGIKNIVDGNSFDLGKLGAGIAGQIAGMAASMGLNAMWAVDDESSTGEQVAHKMAEGFVQDLVNQLMAAALTDATFNKIGDNLFDNTFIGKLKAQLAKASPVANNPALRVADMDDKGFAISSGSGSVFIEGLAAAREGDEVAAAGKLVYNGAATVKMNSMPAARADGKIGPSLSVVGKFLAGASRTFIGMPATGNMPPKPEVPTNHGHSGRTLGSSNCGQNKKVENNCVKDQLSSKEEQTEDKECSILTESEKKKIFEEARSGSKQHVQAAIEALKEAKLQSDPGLDRFFGLDPSLQGVNEYQASIDKLIDTYETIATRLDDMTMVYHDLYPSDGNSSCSTGEIHVPAFTMPGDDYEFNHLHVTHDFFDSDADDRTNSFIHETSHLTNFGNPGDVVGGADDHGYYDPDTGGFWTSEAKVNPDGDPCKSVPVNLSTQEMMVNADSISEYAMSQGVSTSESLIGSMNK